MFHMAQYPCFMGIGEGRLAIEDCDGNSIHVWYQPWLKTIDNDYVISTCSNGNNFDLKVGDLIDHVTCTWKLNEVAEISITKIDVIFIGA